MPTRTTDFADLLRAARGTMDPRFHTIDEIADMAYFVHQCSMPQEELLNLPHNVAIGKLRAAARALWGELTPAPVEPAPARRAKQLNLF